MEDTTPNQAGATSYTRIARASATIHLTTAAGTPIDLQINAGTTADEIGALLAAIDTAGRIAIGKGYKPAPMPTASSPTPAGQAITAPQFCGFTCSPTTDDRGLPSWLLTPDGKQAQRREKQGDTWYSVKTGEEEYAPILRIPKGEKIPAIVWPATMQQQPAAGR